MAPKITRRDFLKLSGITAGLLAVSGCTANLQETTWMEPYVRPPEQTLPGEDFWFASTCRMCPAACGIIVRVSNGRARKIEGNREHPVSRGGLCARGQAGLQLLYHPDRLKEIRIRTGERGAGRWGTTSWEDVVQRIAAILESTDPKRVAFLAGKVPHQHAELVRRFMDGLGAPAPIFYDAEVALDGRRMLEAAMTDLVGEPVLPVFDLASADVVYAFGADFLEVGLSPVADAKRYGDMRGRITGRGFFAAFSPRFSMTAANADHWIPVAPGTEGLIALALGKIILDEGWGHADSREAFRDLYAGVDVTAIAQRSGVSEETLRQYARIFADGLRPVAIPGGLLAAYTNGLDATKAVLMLNQVVGAVDGQSPVYLSPQPPSRDLRLPNTGSLNDVKALVDRMAAGQVDVLFVLDANPVYDLPGELNFASALQQVGNIIVFSTLPTETSETADIVLPTHTYLESWGYELVTPGTDRLVVSAQQPVVQPLYDTRDAGDVLLALADVLGGKVARRLPWPNMVSFIQTRLTSLLKKKGNIEVKDIKAFWPVWLQHGGWWSDEVAWTPFQVTGEVASLDVSSPEFVGDEGSFPFVLLPVPSLAFGDGRHAGLPWLQEMPDPMTTATWDTWVEVHPDTARRLGVKAGDVVKVATPVGDITAVVYIYPAIHPNVVAVPVGQGHEALGRWAKGRGANVYRVLTARADEKSGQWHWAATRAALSRTGQTAVLPVIENNIGLDRAREEMHFPG